MRRIAKILAWTLGTLVLLFGVGLAVLMSIDWNRAKPWVDRRVSAALGRPFEIHGDLDVAWERDGLVPRPYVTAHDVHIGPAPNGVGGAAQELAAVDGADLHIEVLPLLVHRVNIPSLHLRAPAVHLARDAQGRTNWSVGDGLSTTPSAWRLHLGQLELDRGQIDYVDAQRKADLHIAITPLDRSYSLDEAVHEEENEFGRAAATHVGKAATEKVTTTARKRGASPERRTEQHYAFAFTATGTWQGAPVHAAGRLGDLFAARDASRPFPIQARGTVGATHLAIVGTLTDPTSPDAIDLRLWMSGPSMDQLYPILGVVLPSTPPYATDGRLVGRFEGDRLTVTYRHFTAQLGGSDLAGKVTYERGGERPVLSGDVASEHLRFVDLAPLIGGEPQPPGAPEKPQPERRLPATPLRVERWRMMDAEVDFAAKQLERDAGALPVGDIATHISLKDGALRLAPLRFAVARGSVGGSIAVDGAKTPPPGKIELSMRDVQLQPLLGDAAALHDTTLGEVNGDLALAGHGDSVAALLGSADGHVAVLMDDGRISKSVLEIAGLNVLNYVLVKLFGDAPVRINCAAATFAAKDGLLTPELFVVDTENTTITIDGSINLANEALDLRVKPQAKSLRVLSLRSPLHVRGTLAHPDVGIDKGPLLARGVGAAALATLTPVAALGALIAPSRERPNACGPVLEALRTAKNTPAEKPTRR